MTELQVEIAELQQQLSEARDTLDAIRAGEVDAFIIKNNNEHTLYTLKSADHTYRIFVEKMVQGAITLNPDNIILYANGSFAAMVGLPLAKVIGSSFEDYIPVQNAHRLKELISNAWYTEQKAEIILQSPMQRKIPVLLSMNVLDFDEGRTLSIIVTDLTLQKQNEIKLLQQNAQLENAQNTTRELNERLEETVKLRTNELFKTTEHFKFLADNIPAIIWTATREGTIDYYNKRWFEYTGIKNIAESGDPDLLLHEEDREQNTLLWNRSIFTGQKFENVLRIRKYDNEYKWYHVRALPFRNEQNEIIAWFGISTDIDNQKKAMEKKDEFISIVSHELKTPVTSIKGYVQVLRYTFEEEGNHMAADVLGKVDAQINKLTTLISDLLDVKKIEHGQLQYHETNFDFNSLVLEIVEETSRVLKDHEINCELDESAELYGDRNKIGQVITNFLDNAGKYSPPGSPVCLRTQKHNNSIVLSVIDEGIGIPEDQQDRIFERFFRVSGQKENTFSGLGLGLYISAEIIKRHKGRIWMESGKGKGSVFHFELPVNPA